MNSERIPRQGDIYRHFKNELYQIVSVATHFKTGEAYVVYQALFGDFRTYVRPLDMFIGAVDCQKYPSVTQKYIFEKVDRSDIAKSNLNNNSNYNYINNSNAQYSNNANSINNNAQYSNNINPINSNTQYNNVNPINSNTQYNNVNPINNNTNYIDDIQYNNNSINSITNNVNTDDDMLINPLLIDFLELDTYRQKLEYFQSIISKLDERLINDICVALDITCNSNSIDDTILHIKDYLQTQTRFEVNR